MRRLAGGGAKQSLSTRRRTRQRESVLFVSVESAGDTATTRNECDCDCDCDRCQSPGPQPSDWRGVYACMPHRWLASEAGAARHCASGVADITHTPYRFTSCVCCSVRTSQVNMKFCRVIAARAVFVFSRLRASRGLVSQLSATRALRVFG